MLNKEKVFYFVTSVVLYFHFSTIILTQCYEQGWKVFKTTYIKSINKNYISPFFEQNWGMFAPNPPNANEYFIIKFHTNLKNSKYIDIHYPIVKSSFANPFSLDQRTIKYFSECYNDIAEKYNKGYTNQEFIRKSYGLQSILNYSKIVLSKQNAFLNSVLENDSIKIDLYLVNEPLNSFENRTFRKGQFYNKLTDIFLATK